MLLSMSFLNYCIIRSFSLLILCCLICSVHLGRSRMVLILQAFLRFCQAINFVLVLIKAVLQNA